jgi:hypothetical protein
MRRSFGSRIRASPETEILAGALKLDQAHPMQCNSFVNDGIVCSRKCERITIGPLALVLRRKN